MKFLFGVNSTRKQNKQNKKKISYSGVREIRTIQPRKKKSQPRNGADTSVLRICNALHTTVRFSVCQLFLMLFCDHPFMKLKPHFNSVPKPLSFSHLTTERNQIQNLFIPLPFMTHRIPCGGPLPTAEEVGIFATWSLFLTNTGCPGHQVHG